MKKTKIIAGPCLFEGPEHAHKMASLLNDIVDHDSFDFYYKTSYDKANRTKSDSVRRLHSIHEFTNTFKSIKETDIKTLTDVHETLQVQIFNESNLDVVQIPALLCKQTDLIMAAARSGLIVNIKKGQFASASDAILAARKASLAKEVWVTERGNFFGYNDLIIDFRNIKKLKDADITTIVDCTHSNKGDKSVTELLALSAIVSGADGLFMEVHDDPDNAPCDGPNMITPEMFQAILTKVKVHVSSN